MYLLVGRYFISFHSMCQADVASFFLISKNSGLKVRSILAVPAYGVFNPVAVLQCCWQARCRLFMGSIRSVGHVLRWSDFQRGHIHMNS